MLDWNAFNKLPGSRYQNFENLCRSLTRLHFERFGRFTAYKQMTGIEFSIYLNENCSLGSSGRNFGWQCKFHERTKSGDLRAASRRDIEESLEKSEIAYPNLTNWILWTPFTLSKKDQKWFYNLHSRLELHLWTDAEVETFAVGPAFFLRGSYFGELILTPEELEQRQKESMQPIRDRWLDPVHQEVDAERTIRKMLGDPGSWNIFINVGKRLEKSAHICSAYVSNSPSSLDSIILLFEEVCASLAEMSLEFHGILTDGDLDLIQLRLQQSKTLIDTNIKNLPRLLRNVRSPIALMATNALDDMRIAQSLFDKVEDFLGVGLVAVLADAGGGKTQMAVQLTVPQDERPAGILFLGKSLKRGETLNDLAHQYLINGNPSESMESLIAALDAAGKRSGYRLPLVIDGLNEAENPKDWHDTLARVSETIRKYPNVLIICTLRTGERRRDEQEYWNNSGRANRESFAHMSLPESVNKIESQGFGFDAEKAIDKYFSYFKIDPGDADIPVDFLQHPLTLRIYCEITNPKRTEFVNVNYFPASLAPLFEKYIANICDRISRMSFANGSYTAAVVDAAIYRFGLKLWDSKRREINEDDYKSAISDSGHWDSSFVNLLSQEGIIFRNPGEEPGDYYLMPAYDTLGGYLAANSILRKFASSLTFPFFEESVAVPFFTGAESHELAYDTFRALAWLLPRRFHGRQLWKEAPRSLKGVALEFTTELDPEYLDDSTVSALQKLLKVSSKSRYRLFKRLQRTRGIVNHPLNSIFLYNSLTEISVADRDLGWTDWVRRNKRNHLNDIQQIEQEWKVNQNRRTSVDRLRVKWIMWILTSTDHELRDLSTRAIYWYGRGAPKALYDECVQSLAINDPYIPERMLAVSYGIAMALHVDDDNSEFIDNILPNFAITLYTKLFIENAQLGTTHILICEYASRIIELALFHHSDCLTSEQIERCKPPYKDIGLQAWGMVDITVDEHHGPDSPFRMDFENYTIGGLVQNRNNYDFANPEFKKIRSQVLWRVQQLGWSIERFKDLDNSIGRERMTPRIGGTAWRVDRYGKKYSWIAYYEMAGYLRDRGLLDEWNGRSLAVDIDFSFPEQVTKYRLIDIDILGDPGIDTHEWITNGLAPNLTPFLRLTELLNSEGPWVALDGFVVQQDEDRGRKSFCFIRSFLVSTEDVDEVLSLLEQQHLGGRWLPEKDEFSHTMNGEIPWCDTFPAYESEEFSFVTKEEKIKVQKVRKEIYKNGEKIDDWHVISIYSELETDSMEYISDLQLKGIVIKEVLVESEEIEQEHTKFNVIIPVCDINWEGNESAASNSTHARTLPKQISLELELRGNPQSFDLFNKDGSKATFNISDQSSDYNNRQSMFFIKEGFIKDYLVRNGLSLIWAIWGEREYSSGQFDKMMGTREPPQPGYAVFKALSRYDPESLSVNSEYTENH